MKKHVPLLMSIILTIVGVLFLFVSVFITLDTQKFFKTASISQGTVVDLLEKISEDDDGRIKYSYTPVFEFELPSSEVIRSVSSMSSNPPSYSVGESVEIYYDPMNPNKIKIDSFFERWFLPIMFFVFGLIGSISGSFALWKIKQRKDDIEWLQTYGQQVNAIFQSAQYKEGYKVNGQSPWKIYAQWQNPQDQQIYTFESDYVWFDPTSYISQGQAIVATIDPSNPKRHTLDISFLPQAA